MATEKGRQSHAFVGSSSLIVSTGNSVCLLWPCPALAPPTRIRGAVVAPGKSSTIIDLFLRCMGLADVLLVRRPPRPLEEEEASTDDEAAAELDDSADTCRPTTPQQEPSQMENKEPSQISYRMVEDLLAPYFSDSDDSDAGQTADSTRNANDGEPSEAGAAVEDNQKAQKRRAAQKPLPPSVAAAVRRAIQRSSSLPGQLASTHRPRMHSCAAPWNTSAAAPLTRVGCSTGQRWPVETPEVGLSSSSPLNAARRSSAVERRPV